jgi:hypothetical protein
MGSYASEAIEAGGPVYVRSASDRVGILCAPAKDAKCN